jgi:hypothetical protein
MKETFNALIRHVQPLVDAALDRVLPVFFNLCVIWNRYAHVVSFFHLLFMRKEELQPADFARYAHALHDAVETICASPQFSTSPKSCEFLRHIVRHALRGDFDELKERLIGIALLGRTANYDTGSDAGVRVRANDVRKRLNAYYAANPGTPIKVDLAAGTYVPRFLHSEPLQIVQPVAIAPAIVEPLRAELVRVEPARAEPSPLPPLPLYSIAVPTLVALFLCTVCIRWQLAQEHPFSTFWRSALQDHHALLYLPASDSTGGRDLISRELLEAAAPLLDLAGEFHSRFILTSADVLPVSSADTLVTVGAEGEWDASDTHSAPYRLILEDTPAGRRIVDRARQIPQMQLDGRAALLTILNGAHRMIQIDGTDDAAISALVRQLCERDSFPDDLGDSFETASVTQFVFPMAPGAHAVVLHEALPKSVSSAHEVR